MSIKDKLTAQNIFLIFSALFITSLVVSNLIFKKFFYWHPIEFEVFGVKLFEMSVGILPYPITFLITDLISEIYGKRKANQVVFTGIFASLFSLLILFVSNQVQATSWSPISDQTFDNVFGSAKIAVFSSMLAYLFAQFIDIQIYHFWKKRTKGKHLWLRNNFSTFSSQFIDTFTVLFLLCLFEEIAWNKFYGLLIAGVSFKILIALADTPLLYLGVYLMRKRFNIKINDTLKIS